jgi:FtsZ-binding cell division protein ZapB
VTLDNANEGIMSREAFEKWWRKSKYFEITEPDEVHLYSARAAWYARQPEIDALKRANDDMAKGSFALIRDNQIQIAALQTKNEALKAEVDHWKVSYANMVSRSRVLLERTDLPLERAKDFEYIGKLQAENAKLKAQLADTVTDMGWQIDSLKKKSDELAVCLHERCVEVANLKAENERLRKDAEHVCKAAEGLQNASNELWKSENPDEAWASFEEKTKLMSSDDARQAHVEAWRTLDYAIYYMRKNAAMKDFSTREKEESGQ